MINAVSGLGTYSPVYLPQAASKTAPIWTAKRPSNPEAAVEPVTPVRPTPSADSSQGRLFRQELPAIRQGVDPAEWAVRMRIQYVQPDAQQAGAPQEGQAEQPTMAGPAAELLPGGPVQNGEAVPGLPGRAEEGALPDQPEEDAAAADAALGAGDVQKAAEEGRCETCEKRKYQDGSDDPGVSFKTPTNVSPEQAASAVRGHEQEHVVREQAKAQREDRRVVSQSVTYHTDICPECGKVYVSGGTTRTVTAANPQEQAEPQQKPQQPYAPFSAVA